MNFMPATPYQEFSQPSSFKPLRLSEVLGARPPLALDDNRLSWPPKRERELPEFITQVLPNCWTREIQSVHAARVSTMLQTPFAFVREQRLLLCRCCVDPNEPFLLRQPTGFSDQRRLADHEAPFYEENHDFGQVERALGQAPIVDSHCHIFHSKDILPAMPYVGVVLAVCETDWQSVVDVCRLRKELVPGFGIHPWEAHRVSVGFEDKLRRQLTLHPGAIVGEIGLCKCAKNVRGSDRARGWASQMRVFTAQLQVAEQFWRPVSIHCVRAFAQVKAGIENFRLRSVALHSFSGTPRQVEQLPGAFFGFSHTINWSSDPKRRSALYETIRAVPADRILAESDVDDPAEARRATCLAVECVARARGWPLLHAATILARNAQRWLHDFEQSYGDNSRPETARSLTSADSEEEKQTRSDEELDVLVQMRAVVATHISAQSVQPVSRRTYAPQLIIHDSATRMENKKFADTIAESERKKGRH